MLADCTAHSAAEPRLNLLYDLPLLLLPAVAQPLAALLPYGCGTPLAGAALPILQKCAVISVYRGTTQCGERQQCRYFARSLPPGKRHSRLTTVRRGCCQITTRRDSWRSHVHRTHTAQRVQPFKLQTRNGGVKGRRPLRSLGGPREIFSHVREYLPYPQPHTVWGKAAASSGCSPSAPCAEKERTSLSRSPLFLPIFCCAEAIIPLPASPSRQRQPSPVRRRNTARSARSASRTSRGTGSWSAGQWRSSSALPRGTRPR